MKAKELKEKLKNIPDEAEIYLVDREYIEFARPLEFIDKEELFVCDDGEEHRGLNWEKEEHETLTETKVEKVKKVYVLKPKGWDYDIHG